MTVLHHHLVLAVGVFLSVVFLLEINSSSFVGAFSISGKRYYINNKTTPPSQPSEHDKGEKDQSPAPKTSVSLGREISMHNQQVNSVVPASSDEERRDVVVVPFGMAQRLYRGPASGGGGNNKSATTAAAAAVNTSGKGMMNGTNNNGPSDEILECKFVTGDVRQDKELPRFYIPAIDKQIYELGVREIAAQMATSSSTAPADAGGGGGKVSLAIECENLRTETKAVDCRVCIYNEVSRDKKHLRQGQVMDTKLNECMGGKFLNTGKMVESTYHPICYPPPSKKASTNYLPKAAAGSGRSNGVSGGNTIFENSEAGGGGIDARILNFETNTNNGLGQMVQGEDGSLFYLLGHDYFGDELEEGNSFNGGVVEEDNGRMVDINRLGMELDGAEEEDEGVGDGLDYLALMNGSAEPAAAAEEAYYGYAMDDGMNQYEAAAVPEDVNTTMLLQDILSQYYYGKGQGDAVNPWTYDAEEGDYEGGAVLDDALTDMEGSRQEAAVVNNNNLGGNMGEEQQWYNLYGGGGEPVAEPEVQGGDNIVMLQDDDNAEEPSVFYGGEPSVFYGVY